MGADFHRPHWSWDLRSHGITAQENSIYFFTKDYRASFLTRERSCCNAAPAGSSVGSSGLLASMDWNVNTILAGIRVSCFQPGTILTILNEIYFMYQELYKLLIKNYL